MKLQRNKLLKEVSSFGIGGPANFFLEAFSKEEIKEAFVFAKEQNLRFLIIGNGSNCLFSDKGFDGLVIQNKISFFDLAETSLEVGAGYNFSRLGFESSKLGLSGLEFAYGIPGSVGGAIYMNAGANKQEVFDTLKEVSFMHIDGEEELILKKNLKWGYRFSSFKEKEGAIVSAVFNLTPFPNALEMAKKNLALRNTSQPISHKSAGCVFKNPLTASAGLLIEKCGLKNLKVGGASISNLHANFIVNDDNASAKDVLNLMKEIQNVVKAKTNVSLEPEICTISYSRDDKDEF